MARRRVDDKRGVGESPGKWCPAYCELTGDANTVDDAK